MAKDMINNGINAEDKSRMIQEYVPGKQITLAHMVTRPKASVYKKLGLPDDYHDAIGILTITPSEATIIAADICTTLQPPVPSLPRTELSLLLP